MLHGVDGGRAALPIRECHDALHAQQILAMLLRKATQRHGKAKPRHRPAQRHREGGDAVRMHRGREAAGARDGGDGAAEQQRRRVAQLCIDQAGQRVQRGELRTKCIGGRCQVGLGQQQPVRTRGLRDGFGEAFQRAGTQHGVDRGDHGINAQRRLQKGIRREGVENRRWLRQAARLQHDAAERAMFAAREAPEQHIQRLCQILPHRAAHAAIGQFHHVLIHRFEQQVIEADGAEFIDDDGGVHKARARQHAREEAGLAAAQEARQH